MSDPRCSIVIPARNESHGILETLSRIVTAMTIPFECLVVVDSLEDSTIAPVQEFAIKFPHFKCLVNISGQGPAAALQYGIDRSNSEVIVITMADGSDDPKIIPNLVSIVENGAAVAVASRYMKGGQQIGASWFKKSLSKSVGKSLSLLPGINTKDATNSFKAYDRSFLEHVKIESSHGFEMGLELVAKAKRFGYLVSEIPTIWIERTQGISNFKLFKWAPRYLHWYFYALKPQRSLTK